MTPDIQRRQLVDIALNRCYLVAPLPEHPVPLELHRQGDIPVLLGIGRDHEVRVLVRRLALGVDNEVEVVGAVYLVEAVS